METEMGGDPSVPTLDSDAEQTKKGQHCIWQTRNQETDPDAPGEESPCKAHAERRLWVMKKPSREKKRGGKRRRKTKETGLPGTGEPGDGSSRIRGNDLTFRSWVTQDVGTDHSLIALAITASNDEAGDLELIGLGQGGVPEKDFQLRIARAVHHLSSGNQDIEVSGNTLKNLSFSAGQNSRIDIYVPAGERYRLGVL